MLLRLKAYQFKNYDHIDIEWSSTFNVITGDNGMGKTNVVDAVHYLCLTKSYFNTKDRYVIKDQRDACRVEGRFGQEEAEQVVIKNYLDKPKELWIDDKKITSYGDYIGRYPCVVIAPDDIVNLLSASAARRKLLNRTIGQVDSVYLGHLMRYNKLLKQRNALLKQFQEQRYFDKSLIDTYTQAMIAPAEYIHQKRKETVAYLSDLHEKYYTTLSRGLEESRLEYSSKLSEQSLEDLMAKNLEKDRYTARTNAGIHKDDLSFTLKSFDLKNYASQGQLKSYLVAIKLSQYDYMQSKSVKKPILILDDLYDKLDAHRVSQLIEVVEREGMGQIFITDTDQHRIPEILKSQDKSYNLYYVQDDVINELG